jgi:hypothetical protein
MAVFDRLSRYVKPPLTTYDVTDVRGRQVKALPSPDAPNEIAVGQHVKKEGQTADQLANGYLADPNAYWRLAEVNEVIIPDALEDLTLVKIPAPNR